MSVAAAESAEAAANVEAAEVTTDPTPDAAEGMTEVAEAATAMRAEAAEVADGIAEASVPAEPAAVGSGHADSHAGA